VDPVIQACGKAFFSQEAHRAEESLKVFALNAFGAMIHEFVE
jgi:hypothetical protein